MNQYNYEYAGTETVLLDAYHTIQSAKVMIFKSLDSIWNFAIHYNASNSKLTFFEYEKQSERGESIYKIVTNFPLGLLMAISQHAIITNG